MHAKGKCSKEGSGPAAVPSEDGQVLNQSGESTAEPCLEQNQSNFPRTGLGTGFKHRGRTALEQDQKQVPEQA